jgi:hypothetical protein
LAGFLKPEPMNLTLFFFWSSQHHGGFFDHDTKDFRLWSLIFRHTTSFHYPFTSAAVEQPTNIIIITLRRDYRTRNCATPDAQTRSPYSGRKKSRGLPRLSQFHLSPSSEKRRLRKDRSLNSPVGGRPARNNN